MQGIGTVMANFKFRKLMRKNLVYFLLIAGSIVFLIPFFWMLSTSLKGGQSEIFSFPPQWIPKKLYWQNYTEALAIYPWLTFLRNSCIITFVGLTGTILSSSIVAFGFARLQFPGRDILFLVLLSTLMIPYHTTLIPMYILFTRLGWVNTLKPLYVPNFFGSAFFIFLLRQFYLGIPLELDDAARIDGCNTFQIFYKILLPLTKPALVTVGILQFMAAWNDFLGPLIYLQSQSKYTLALGLNAFRGAYFTYWHYLMAASLLVCLPAIILFFIAQKQILGGISISGLKV